MDITARFTYTVGRGTVVHASLDSSSRDAKMFCGAESHNGPRRGVSVAAGQPVTCRSCLKIGAGLASAFEAPTVAPEPYAAPIGPVTAFEAVVAASRAANARVFG